MLTAWVILFLHRLHGVFLLHCDLEASVSEKPVVLISSMATKEVLRELLAQFQPVSDIAVQAISAGGVDVAKRVRGGEAFDMVVLARDAIDLLVQDGLLLADSCTDLVRSGISVAVRAGAQRPDIGTEAALRQAVLDAPSLSYSTGPSGTYLSGLFQRWGIHESISGRIVQAPPGVPVGSLVARGDVALGFQQLSELLHLPGIDIVGALPAPIQLMTVFSGAVTTISGRARAAHALLALLASPAAAPTMRRQGMEPA